MNAVPAAAAVSKTEAPLILQTVSNQSSMIYADGTVHEMNCSIPEWLNDQCLHNGSSMEGRIASFRFLTGAHQKSAVMISERTRLIYFPLFGMKEKENIWIRYDSIMSCRSISLHETELLFSSGYRHIIPVNRRVAAGQMKRAENYLEQLRSIYPYDPE